MEKKHLLAILFAIICIFLLLIFFYSLYFQPTPQGINSNVLPEPENPTNGGTTNGGTTNGGTTNGGTTNGGTTNGGTTYGGELFVIPENPAGTLGLVTAIAIAFGVFTLLKKR